MPRRSALALLAALASAPLVADETIEIPAGPIGGWKTLETWTPEGGTRIWCEGGGTLVCTVPVGTYTLVNHYARTRERIDVVETVTSPAPAQPVEPEANAFTRVSESCRIPQEALTPRSLHTCTASCDGELVGLLSCSVSFEIEGPSDCASSPNVPCTGRYRESRFQPIASFKANGNSMVCATWLAEDITDLTIRTFFDIEVAITCR